MDIHLDIETFSGEKPEIEPFVPPTAEDIKYGNLKNPAKRAAKAEAELPQLIEDAHAKYLADADKAWRDQSLNKFKCQVIAYSIIIPSINFHSECINENEEYVINHLNEAIKGLGQEALSAHWYTQNGEGFDLPILALRALKYKARRLFTAIPTRKFDPRSFDTKTIFGFTNYQGRPSLKHLARYFGMDKGEGLDGSMVHDAWLNKEYDRILKYCIQDVQLLVDLMNIYKFKDMDV